LAVQFGEITLKEGYLVQIYTDCLSLYHKLSISALLQAPFRRTSKRKVGKIPRRNPETATERWFSNAHYSIEITPFSHKNSDGPHRLASTRCNIVTASYFFLTIVLLFCLAQIEARR